MTAESSTEVGAGRGVSSRTRTVLARLTAGIPGFWEYWLRAVAWQVVHGGSPDRAGS